jgi:hypothetical protein
VLINYVTFFKSTWSCAQFSCTNVRLQGRDTTQTVTNLSPERPELNIRAGNCTCENCFAYLIGKSRSSGLWRQRSMLAEDGGSVDFWKVSALSQHYTASQPRTDLNHHRSESFEICIWFSSVGHFPTNVPYSVGAADTPEVQAPRGSASLYSVINMYGSMTLKFVPTAVKLSDVKNPLAARCFFGRNILDALICIPQPPPQPNEV